ncbi:MAG: RidA family protein [Proteobacteria bacterium]|nr:RidA family protein [Burkholderiales bacterium]
MPWLGHEFVALSAEGDPRGSIEDEMAGLLARMDAQLRQRGLGLDDTVRTRLWARDMTAWAGAVEERARILSGPARSVSSSHIRPSRFASDARLSLDLLAMRPNDPASRKVCVEYEPPTIVLRHLVLERVLFISGNTVVMPSFDEQLPVVVGRIADTLAIAGSSWQRVVRASFFLHVSQDMDHLRAAFRRLVPCEVAGCEYAPVDTRQGKLIEIEVTAEV